jgi:hypothetical protein
MEKLVLSKTQVMSIKKSLIESLSIASGSKSTATYYHTKDEQVDALKKHVKELYGLSKELPLIIATQKGVTGKYISEVILNEFKQTYTGGACNIVNPVDWYDGGISENALLLALSNLNDVGITYVLRMFVDLKTNKINNERSKKIVLGYLWGHPNLEFFAMKYRNKIKDIFKHVYGELTTSVLLSIAEKYCEATPIMEEKEVRNFRKQVGRYSVYSNEKSAKILLFIFGRTDGVEYKKDELALLYEYMQAKANIFSTSKVPEEILRGLIADVNHPQYFQLWSNEAKRKDTMAKIRQSDTVTSVNQQIRQTKSSKELGVNKSVDMHKATDFLALYKTGYEDGFTEKIQSAIDSLAEKKKINNFLYENIGIIVDTSTSMDGHAVESKNTPKAIAEFTAAVLKKSAKNSIIVETNSHEEDFSSTDLATAFLTLLRKESDISVGYDAVYVPTTGMEALFVITDGYENTYDGLFQEVLNVYQSQTGRNLPVFQISPITGAEMGSGVRKIAANAFPISVNDPVSIQPQIDAKLLEVDTKLWLERQIQKIKALPSKRIVSKETV